MGVLVVLTAGGATAATAGGKDGLAVGGPVSVQGTEASGVFEIDGRTIRQVRYADGGTLRYSFVLRNQADDDVRVTADPADQLDTRLLHFEGLTADGGDEVVVPGDGELRVVVSLAMSGCESLSSRSGSFFDRLSVLAGDQRLKLVLPEELHTGSPREAFCPGATATSRPQG